MVSRVQYDKVKVYVDSSLLTGVRAISWDLPRSVTPIQELGNIAVNKAINSQSDEGLVKLNGYLGGPSSDLFFDFQASGLMSHESFVISSRDAVGETIASGCYLSSIGIDVTLGAPLSVSAEYTFDDYGTNQTGNILNSGETDHTFEVFLPKDVTFFGDWEDSIDPTGVCAQSISISLPLNRVPVRVVGSQYPRYSKISTPVLGNCSVDIIKRQSTGINLAPQIDSGGTLSVLCAGTGSQKLIQLENARLIGLRESVDVDNKSIVSFEYEFSPTNNIDFITTTSL